MTAVTPHAAQNRTMTQDEAPTNQRRPPQTSAFHLLSQKTTRFDPCTGESPLANRCGESPSVGWRPVDWRRVWDSLRRAGRRPRPLALSTTHRSPASGHSMFDIRPIQGNSGKFIAPCKAWFFSG